MMTALSLLLAAAMHIRLSAGLEILYENAGPLDPQSDDLLTNIDMTDNMFIKMDILVESMPTHYKSLFFIGDPSARVPEIVIWNQDVYNGYYKGFSAHFSRAGSGRWNPSLSGSSDKIESNKVYTLEVCYGQTTFTTRTSGGDIDGIYKRTGTKAIHDNVEEPVHVGYPNGDDRYDADVIITNLYIGSNADCSQPLDIPTVLYENAGPLDPQSDDLLTNIDMTDNMFIKMDIEMESFPTNIGNLLLIGDSFANRVPHIFSSSTDFIVLFVANGGAAIHTLWGSSNNIETNKVYTLEICWGKSTFTTRISGGDIDGIYAQTRTKPIHDNVEEPVHVGWPNSDHSDADAIITNLYIGSNADCTQPLDIPTADKLVYVETPMKASAAKAYCESEYDGHLASIHSAAENEVITNLCVDQGQTQGACWLGMSNWVTPTEWFDGTSIDYTSWYVGEPDAAGSQPCVVMRQGLWHTVGYCDTDPLPFVCEQGKECIDEEVSLTDMDTTDHCSNCWGGYKINCWTHGCNSMPMGDGNEYAEYIVIHPPVNGIGFGEYALDGKYKRFTGIIGIANAGNRCSTHSFNFKFLIKVDGVLKYQSDDIELYDQTEFVDIDVTDGQTLRIETSSNGHNACDQATIAAPTLSLCAASSSTLVIDPIENLLNKPFDHDDNGYYIEISKPVFLAILGLIAIVIFMNIMTICCVKGRNKNGNKGYGVVKHVDSDSEDV